MKTPFGGSPAMAAPIPHAIAPAAIANSKAAMRVQRFTEGVHPAVHPGVHRIS